MSSRFIPSVTLRWHVRKTRRLFQLLSGSLLSQRSATRTGVRWG